MFDPNGPTLLELTRQALSSTTTGYDLLARKFDYTPFRTPPIFLAALKAMALAPGKPIRRHLDLCCGTGAALEVMRPFVTQKSVGVDLSQGMLDQAKENLASVKGPGTVDLIHSDILAFSPPHTFDLITCCGAFGHIMPPEQPAFAKVLWEALEPGGRFIFLSHLMPPPASKSWLMARGFNAVMHLRNALLRPPFVMFYLTFTLERASDILGTQGFGLHIEAPFAGMEHIEAMRVVCATKPKA